MASVRCQLTKSIYDNRAKDYDGEEGFHPRQAADYIKWMALLPGQNVLDLACGTGTITVSAKEKVGSSGQVLGIDLSTAMLEVATQKAKEKILNVTFVNHDICRLDELEELRSVLFDVITCASAFVLLEDPVAVVKQWAELLKPGGRLIFDVLTPKTMIPGFVLELVAKELNIPIIYHRSWATSIERVKQVLFEAGLEASESFVSESYQSNSYTVDEASMIFGRIIDKNDLWEPVYRGFRDPNVRVRAEKVFCERWKRLADSNGKIHEELRFFMAVGRK